MDIDNEDVQKVTGLWLPVVGDDPSPGVTLFTAVTGLKHAPSPDSSPIDYLKFFFTPELLGHIIKETMMVSGFNITNNTCWPIQKKELYLDPARKNIFYRDEGILGKKY